LYGLSLVNDRAALLPLDDTLQHVYDPYAFIRDAYLQRRAYLVSDGKVSEEPLVDPGADNPDSDKPEGDKPAPPPSAPTPPPSAPTPPP
jgi:phospholipid-binding lipoprotein MlaA